ncbi:hypothetical protein CASFOL_036363 [Castilleja foliolosa]|uniref:Uncharacterized protein n=1 Tax=Castilleja foliolosa TaxID=1961234 RepID=A0ABD3BWI0_9LAMI
MSMASLIVLCFILFIFPFTIVFMQITKVMLYMRGSKYWMIQRPVH